MKMKYRVKLYNDFTEPYWARDNVEECPVVEHKSVEEYVAYDKLTFEKILEDLVDAPKKKLTDEEVRKDFDTSYQPKLSDSRVEVIKAYYNGRLKLKKKIDSDLAKVGIDKMKKGFPAMLKYNIPFEMNYFSCDEDDPCDKLTKMNDSYIEIEISKED